MKVEDLFGGNSIDKMPFGKYKGWKFNQIPDSYLVWLHDSANMDELLKQGVEAEMLERFKKMITVSKNEKEEKLMEYIDASYWNGEIY